jgi:predicted short-subunit dehydrogenase-like oxidoreductase (DUF2520 family)
MSWDDFQTEANYELQTQKSWRSCQGDGKYESQTEIWTLVFPHEANYESQTQIMERVTIVGKSRVGRSLIAAMAGSRISAIVSARSARFPRIESEVLIIATKDDKIAEVARTAVQVCGDQLKIVVHLAGSQPSTILPVRDGVVRLTLHPIQTFPKASPELFEGITWMASSEDAAAIKWARKFVKELGGKRVIVLPSEALPLYHAMTVFSSNFVTLLGGAIEEMSEALGQNPKKMKAAIRPLMEQAMKNVLAKPAKDVLTGPIKRGDVKTIRMHQKALKALDLKLRKVYDAFLGLSEL